MHSRIFQIESSPVDVEDRICEDTIPEWFTGSIADYVADIKADNREEEIEWLMSTNFGKVCERVGDELTFKIDVGDFFEKDFELFKETVDGLSKVTFDQFISGHQTDIPVNKTLYHLMFTLKEAYDDKYGFYVWNDGDLCTMQSWMRHVEPCGVYYLGGIVDYHF